MNPTTSTVRGVARRSFLATSTTLAAGLAFAPSLRAQGAGRRLVVGVMGLGRGGAHVAALLQIPNVEVAYLAEVDDARVPKVAKQFAAAARSPKVVKDFRRILDDKAVDALFVAAPNHWHAPATILACAAGKHVYVEKPGSHNARESELIVAAARKHQRVVQMGNQRRSWPALIEAVEKLRGGVIGKVFSARCWYNNSRGTIGRGKAAAVPPGLDYSLWQGPAPERAYVDNLVHYNWHWRWHWGGGELANNGVHGLDLARWGLGAELPSRVACNGGRYHFADDQETPDTTMAAFHFGDRAIFFDASSCNPRGADDHPFVAWYGEKGSLANVGNGYKVYDPKGKVLAENPGTGGEKGHIENFLGAIRGEAKANSEIATGQVAALLCHFGNIAYRTGRTLDVNSATGRVVGCPEAEAFWGREYRAGWEPKV